MLSKSDNGKVFKFGGGEGGFRKKNENIINSIRKLIYTLNFIRIGRWESVQNQGKKLGGIDGIHGREEFRKKKYKRHK